YEYEYFYTNYTPNTGSSSTDTFYMQFFDLTYDQYTNTFPLAGQNYSAQLGLYLLIHEDGGSKKYYQKEGTVSVTYDYEHGWGFCIITSCYDDLRATLTDVVLEEVTIDSSTSQTTPVSNGSCIKIKNTTLRYYFDEY
ncbi:hypothetical protein IKP13_01995, partial [bacterium]|nr:hypothetical protein [bacterium]